MKITVAELRTRIDERLAARTAAASEGHEKATAEWQAKVDTWKAEQAPQLAAELRRIADRARKGRIVTDKDFDGIIGRWSSGPQLVFAGKAEPPKARPVVHPEELFALRDFLATLNEEVVTTSALANVGFRNLRELFR